MRTEDGNRVHLNPRPVKARPLFTDTIPGDVAVWCLDCETVFDLRATSCPSCGSKAAMLIKRILDRKVEVYR